MKREQGSGAWGCRLPAVDPVLRDSVIRVTAKDPRTFGSVLARLREKGRLTLEEQAAALGVSGSALVFLCVFRLPRAAHREADLTAVVSAVGIGGDVLRGLLRDSGEWTAASALGDEAA
jgi:hypothetical protein